MNVKEIKKWIDVRKKQIIDPGNDGFQEGDAENEFNERQQIELQLLNEFKDLLT